MTKRINDFNRLDLQSQYVDHIVGSMDFITVKQRLRDYLEIEKDRESDADLEAEILNEAPYLLQETWEELEELQMSHA
jgi:hypothetical protein